MVDLSIVEGFEVEGAGAGVATLARTGMTSLTRYSEGGAARRRKGSVVMMITKAMSNAKAPLCTRGSILASPARRAARRSGANNQRSRPRKRRKAPRK